MGTAQASDYLENLILDHLFRSRTWAKPTTHYLALFTTPPTDAGGGVEPSGNGYSRPGFPPSDANFTATQGGTSGNSTGTTGATSNATNLTMPTPTGPWGTVTHWGLYDAATGGNLVLWDALATPREITTGDPAPTFAAGAFQFSIT
jgi:hypothetical protein